MTGRFLASLRPTCLTENVLLQAVLFSMASLAASEAQTLELSEDPVWLEGRAFFRVLEGETRAADPEQPIEPVVRYRVMVERGLEGEAASFTQTVDRVLQDPEGWSRAGRRFIRVEEGPAITVLLATPNTVDELCAPLDTGGQLSCGRKRRATLNLVRWRQGVVHWGDDLKGYRAYMINHEVGHLLGIPHRPCGGDGEAAPVMLQQTKKLDGCVPENRPSEHELDLLRRRWSR